MGTTSTKGQQILEQLGKLDGNSGDTGAAKAAIDHLMAGSVMDLITQKSRQQMLFSPAVGAPLPSQAQDDRGSYFGAGVLEKHLTSLEETIVRRLEAKVEDCLSRMESRFEEQATAVNSFGEILKELQGQQDLA